MNCDQLEPPGDPQSGPAAQPLSPALGERLADLALMSEEHAALSDGCDVADAPLAAYAARRSELGSAADVLRRKVTELGALQSAAAHLVMRYSIMLEDAAALRHCAREHRE